MLEMQPNAMPTTSYRADQETVAQFGLDNKKVDLP